MRRKGNFLYTVDTEQLQKIYEEGKPITIGKFYKTTFRNKIIKPIILANGKPFNINYNPSTIQTNKMLETVKQFADIVNTGNNHYLIRNIYNKPILIPEKNYKEYLTPLIIEVLYEYCMLKMTPNSYVVENIFDNTTDDIARKLNILGDKYNYYIATKYSKDLKYNFYNDYFILQNGFFGYMITRLNFIVKNNIEYAINELPIKYGIAKRKIGIVGNNRLDDESNAIFSDILNSIDSCDFLLEKQANKEFMIRLEKERKDLFLKYVDKEIKLSWEFKIYPDLFNESYWDERLSNNDLLYCKEKLKVSFKDKFVNLSPIDMLNEYKDKLKNGEITSFDGYIQQNDKGFKYDIYRLEDYIYSFQNEIMDCFIS